MQDKKKLFISWSGELSKYIAEELKSFYEETLHIVDPFFSPDIEKGTGWLDQINKSIDNSIGGIICLTKENHQKPWVLFESGALSRVGLVCPIVFNLEKSEIKSPLSIFQASEFNKKDFKKLFEDLNKKSEANLTQKVIDRYFENDGVFDKLERKVNVIMSDFNHIDSNNSNDIYSLILELNEKVNTLLNKDSVDFESNFKYIEIQIDNLKSLILSLDNGNAKNVKSQISSIFITIDYLVSCLPQNNSKENIIRKFNELDSIIKTL